jgi:anthranilate synthase component 1
MYYPRFSEYRESAKYFNLVPVWREILADLETPVSAFCKIREKHSYLLESAQSQERIGRYSFLGTSANIIFEVKDRIYIKTGDEEEIREMGENPLLALKEILKSYRPADLPDLPRFFGGAVGYIGYDYIRYIEDIQPRIEEKMGIPLAIFVITENVLIFDHLNHTIKVVANIPITDSPESSYKKAQESIERMIEKLKKPVNINHSRVKTKDPPVFESEREDFEKAVKCAKEYIRAGDIFQVVLSQRIRKRTEADALSIYRALRHINPSPYMYLLEFGELSLIGSSPEALVRLEDGWAETRPIAGTRRRGKTEEEDLRLEEELLADPKEKAEHIMLVDLGRNDIGRVCEFSSISLPEFMKIERYSHVMHIVTSVKGKIRNDKDCFDLLSACFPAGTVTGAPKIRACEIIDELEPVRRGVYAGCVGYFSFNGNMDTCITIRTILLYKSIVYIQAGAGIVADSIPEREYKECLNKASAMLSAIELAEEGLK